MVKKGIPSGKKALTLTMPEGLYKRLEELSSKSRLNIHAYCVKQLWINSKWDGNPNKENN